VIMQKLTEDQLRSLFGYLENAEKSGQEIAGKIGITYVRYRQLLSRARAAIRGNFIGDSDDHETSPG
jgi:DNA-directed RNA polymerase specialized sigma24 family protein